MVTILEPNSYRGLIKVVAVYKESEALEEGLLLLRKFCDQNTLAQHRGVVPYFLNYTTRQYEFLHHNAEQLTGYNFTYISDGGLDFYWSRFHKNDFDLLDTTIFPEIMSLVQSYPLDMCKHLIFSRTYRVKSKDGSYVDVLQRYCVINQPNTYTVLGVVGVCIDITHFKQDGTTILTIEYDDPLAEGITPKLLLKKVYFQDSSLSLLSKREIEILKYISDGLASKQIADKLFLSINTVNQHRKNMLYKSGSLNTAELVNNAVKNGLL